MASRRRATKKAKTYLGKGSGNAQRPKEVVAAIKAEPALQRPNYFDGELLSAADLRAEQEYFLAQARRHNRYLVGWGVVHGLDVNAASTQQLIVAPGLAIDCAGNEIYVPTPITLTPKTTSGAQFVVLRYAESLTTPVPMPLSDSLEGDAKTHSRVREGFRLEIVEADPMIAHGSASNATRKPGTPGCGRAHAVGIAGSQRQRKRWSVKLSARR